MSKPREQVFQTTRVRTSMKNDNSWMMISKQDKDKQESTEQAEDPKSTRKSYVLSTAKKFEVSANEGEYSPPQKDAQPEGSTVETSDDIKPKPATEQLIQNGKTQPVDITTAESKEGSADITVAQSNKEQKEVEAEVSADVHVEEIIQNGEAQPVIITTAEIKEGSADVTVDRSNTEQKEVVPEVSADIHVEENIQNGAAKPEQSVASTTAESQEGPADVTVEKTTTEQKEVAVKVSADVQEEEHIQNGETKPVSAAAVSPVEPAEKPDVYTTADIPSNVEHKEVQVSADAHVEDPVAEISAAAATEGSEDTAEVPAALPAELKPEEEPPIQTEPEKADARIETTVQLAEENCSPKQEREQSVAITTAESKEGPADVTVEKTTTEQKEVAVKVSADVQEEQHIQNGETKPVSSAVVEPAEKPDARIETTVQLTEESCAPKQAAKEIVEAVAEVQKKPDEEPTIQSEPAKATHVDDEKIETTEQPAEGSCPPEQASKEIVEAVAEVVVLTSADKSDDVINAKQVEKAALPDSVEPTSVSLAESVSESPAQPAAVTAVESVECKVGSVESKVESAPSAEPVLETTVEEVVECKVQPVKNPVVEQSVEPSPESAAVPDVELKIEDALELVPASEAESVQDKLASPAIELTDALDMEPPTAEAAPEPPKDPKLDQQSDQTTISEMYLKHVEEPQPTQTPVQEIQYRNGVAVCTFCDKTIDGLIKLTFSEPVMCCHPDCLKCGVCAIALGDLLSPMFLHDQMFQCRGCFAKTF